MGMICPPYLNKNVKSLEKRVASAEKKEAQARAKYEEAREYTRLCRQALEDAKK
jgi:exonuclease VII small subunit